MSLNLQVVAYSEKSFKVEGDDTKTYRHELKELGGKFNPCLKGGPGWIFSNKRKSSVENFIKDLQADEPQAEEEIPEREEESDEEFYNFNIGDRVAIDTGYGGHQYWIFGKVVRKTPRTMDIQAYASEKEEIHSGPGGYADKVRPDWDVPKEKIKVWKSGDGMYSFEKDHIVQHFHQHGDYQNCAYY